MNTVASPVPVGTVVSAGTLVREAGRLGPVGPPPVSVAPSPVEMLERFEAPRARGLDPLNASNQGSERFEAPRARGLDPLNASNQGSDRFEASNSRGLDRFEASVSASSAAEQPVVGLSPAVPRPAVTALGPLPAGTPATPPAAPPVAETPPADEPKLTSHVSKWLVALMRPLEYVFLHTFFRPHVQGVENIPTSGPVIIAPTHQSTLDALVVTSLLHREAHYMAAAETMTGIRGWFMRHMGCYPVDRKKPSPQVVTHSVDLLREGKAVVIFPEGKINRDGKVGPLKPGVGRISTTAPADSVVPVAIHYEPGPRFRAKLEVMVGKPIPVAPYLACGDEAAQRLTADLKAELDREKALVVAASRG